MQLFSHSSLSAYTSAYNPPPEHCHTFVTMRTMLVISIIDVEYIKGHAKKTVYSAIV